MFSRVPLVGVDHSLATEVVRAEALKIAPPISVSAAASMSTMQIQSGLETSRAVGSHVAFTTAVANYSSFSTMPLVRYCPPCITPECKSPQVQL